MLLHHKILLHIKDYNTRLRSLIKPDCMSHGLVKSISALSSSGLAGGQSIVVTF